MKTIISIVLIVVMAVVAFQLVKLYGQKSSIGSRLDLMREKIATLSSDNEMIDEDIEYYQNSENLSKELKSKFDYKRPGEDLMIIIPKQ